MHKQISDVLLDGFANHSAQQGETVEIVIRGVMTSDSPTFFVYAEQIANLIFPKLEISTDAVNRYLMVLHQDATADIYLNDFQIRASVRVTRAVEAGEGLRRSDVSSIEDVQFPDISIVKGDRIVYFDRSGWRFGIAFDLSRESDAQAIGVLCAQLQAKLMLEDVLHATLSEFHKAEESSFDAFVITEGKTDWRHLERALREIGYRRKLRFDTSDQDRGDARLLEICQSFALEPRTHPVICVFDRDNGQVLKRLAKLDPEGRGYQDWGNNVFSFAIAAPSHREGYAYLPIEMYYTNELLSRMTPDGRRLCFDNEVKKELVQGKVLRTLLIPAVADLESTKKIVANDVDAIEDESGRKVGLSKARFAELVWTKGEPFADIDFSAFGAVTTQLEEVLNAAKKNSS